MTELPKWIRVSQDGRISYYPNRVVGDGSPRRQLRGGKTFAEAMKRAEEIVAEVEIGAKLKIDIDATWTILFAQWERHHVNVIEEGTYRARMSAINRRLLVVIGNIRLIDTDRSTLTAVIDAAVASGNGSASLDSEVQTLTSIAKWAEERLWLTEDAFGPLSKVRATIKRGRGLAASNNTPEEKIGMRDVPTWQEVLNLANSFHDVILNETGDKILAKQFAAAVRVNAGCGLRQCELLALTTSDVSLSDGTIKVDKQLDRYIPWEVGVSMATRPPKYKMARRVRAWTKIQKDLKFLVDRAGEDGLLIPRIGSASLWADAWAKRLDKAREAVDWRWTQHYLRHHYGSYSTASRDDGGLGQSYPAVQTWMGHKHLETTMRTYIHDVSAAIGWVE
jgi:integrase